jgi:4-hydroxybenzoate polyprenyltransferase
MMRRIKPYLKALRPHQWIKNVLVFLPMLAAHRADGQTFSLSILAFVSFSLVASSVYIVNDLFDLAADRAHPRKKSRPFASGDVPIRHGVWMAAALVSMGAIVAAGVGPEFLVVVAAYYALTLAYSFSLKRKIVLDICVLAGLYSMRIVAGGVATSIHLSVWMLAFSIFFFLSLAAVKRQAELVDGAKRGDLNANGRGYHVDDLPIISMVAIGAGYVSVLVLALYLTSPTVAELYRQPGALWGVCLVLLYWITRMVMIAHRGQMHDDPVVYAVKDPSSHFCLILIFAFGVAAAIA